jgi:hypothetical protein
MIQVQIVVGVEPLREGGDAEFEQKRYRLDMSCVLNLFKSSLKEEER